MSTVSSSPSVDLDTKSLKMLVEAFGTHLSHGVIATAYSRANQDVDAASEVLSGIIGSNSKNDPFPSLVQQSELHGSISVSLEHSTEGILRKSYLEAKRRTPPKQKRISASAGSVSVVIGKQYYKPKVIAAEPKVVVSPPKIDLKAIPVTTVETQDDETSSHVRTNSDKMQTDLEEFILEMLKEGFQVDRSTICDVLRQTGYDVQKSMNTFLDSSDMAMGNSGDFVDAGYDCKQENVTQRDNMGKTTEGLGSSSLRNRVSIGQDREVLQALFSLPERSTSPKKVIMNRDSGIRAFIPCAREPFELPELESSSVLRLEEQPQVEVDENEYKILSEAVSEHLGTMKEYFKAAALAFQQGEFERANRLMEKGRVFKEKALEAGDKSIEKLTEEKDGSTVYLDLQEDEPREALRLFKRQLSFLSGIDSIKYLKIRVGLIGEDVKGLRKRLIMKQLQKESINWTEDADGLVMVIRVDDINPKTLSFAK